MIKEKITENGISVIHFVGAAQGDYALCGQDLAGDLSLGWEEAEQTKEKVDCLHCIEIVEFCKKVKRSEYRSA